MPIDPILAGGAISLASTVAQGAMNRRQWRRAITYDRELRHYNSPAEQIKRLKEAGISSQAFFGSGSTGNASAIGLPINQPEPIGKGLEAGLQAYQSTRLDSLQRELLTAQIDAARADADIKMKDRDDYLTSDYNKIDTKKQELEYKKLKNELTRVQIQMDGIDRDIQRELYNDGTLANTTRQKYQNLVQQNKNLGMQYQSMIVQNEKTAQEILNLITNEKKAQQEIANLVTSDEKMKAEIELILTNEKHVRELINIAYLSQDEKQMAIKQMANELRNAEFETGALRIIFDDLDKFNRGEQSAIGAMPDALIYYGLDKFKLGAFVGKYSSKNTNRNTTTSKNENTNRNYNYGQ